MPVHSFTLPDALTLHTVETVAEELRAHTLTHGDAIIMDATLTQSISMVGVQLLLSVQRTIAALGGALRIENARETMQLAFHDLGCGEQWQTLTTPSS
jgi:anti-anti-sigma regulatory factor